MLKRMSGWIGLAALACGPMCAGAIAQTIIIGGPGGAYFNDQCPQGAYLVGVGVTAGKDMNQITPICQRFLNGHAVGAAFKLRTWGQAEYNGGPFFAAVESRCPNDMAVQGMRVEISHVALVHGVTLRCRNPNAHDYKMSSQAGSGFGEAAYEKPVDCGGGAISDGLIGRYGALVDALGLSCKVIAAPAPPPTRPPPPATGPVTPRPTATALRGNTVYKDKSGNQGQENVVCEMARGDTGVVVSSGPDKWLLLSDISGRCKRKSGNLWNDGELTIR